MPICWNVCKIFEFMGYVGFYVQQFFGMIY